MDVDRILKEILVSADLRDGKMLCCNTHNWSAIPKVWQGGSDGNGGDCDVND
jgi:hypothetical protein